MKKNGQPPDAQTYTIIFHGVGLASNKETALKHGMELYMRMIKTADLRDDIETPDRLGPDADNGGRRERRRMVHIKPNIIHLNALLNACGKATDLDAAMEVAATADDADRRPNEKTYTTIFTVLRSWLIAQESRVREERAPEEREKQRDKHEMMYKTAVRLGGQFWDQTMKEWKAGNVDMTEGLACAYCWLLLRGYPDGKIHAMVMKALHDALGVPILATHLPGLQKTKQWDPSIIEKRLSRSGRSLLSVIFQVCQNMRMASPSVEYWNALVSKGLINPDDDNWRRYLTALRHSKSSRLIAQAVKDMPADVISPQVFNDAFITCLRDNMNKACLEHADVILDKLLSAVKGPLPREYLKFLTMYIHVYRNTHYDIRIGFRDASVLTIDGLKSQYFNRLRHGLDRIMEEGGPFAAVLDKAEKLIPIAFPSEEGTEAPPMRKPHHEVGSPTIDTDKADAQRYLTEAMTLARDIMAVYDGYFLYPRRSIGDVPDHQLGAGPRPLVPEEAKKDLWKVRHGLSQFANRLDALFAGTKPEESMGAREDSSASKEAVERIDGEIRQGRPQRREVPRSEASWDAFEEAAGSADGPGRRGRPKDWQPNRARGRWSPAGDQGQTKGQNTWQDRVRKEKLRERYRDGWTGRKRDWEDRTGALKTALRGMDK